MTINSTTRSAGPFAGTGVIVNYAFAFKVFQASDLSVTQVDSSGVQTTWVLGSRYTVSLNSDQNVSPGGYITPIGAALPIGYSLSLTSTLQALQPLSLTNGGGFFPRNIEDELDRLTILVQQLSTAFGQAIRVPELSGVPAVQTSSLRANTVLGFDSSGNPISVLPLSVVNGDDTFLTREFVHVGKFGATGNGVSDDTAAILAAIASMSRGGVLLFGSGVYKVTSTITNAIGVMFLGRGPGSVGGLGTVTAGTRLKSAVTPGVDMLRVGGFGTLSVGGGIMNMSIDGSGIAGNVLRIKDLQRAKFSGLMIHGVGTNAIELNNSTNIITMRLELEDIYINMNDGVSPINANGIFINGTNTGGSDGATLCSGKRIAIDHRNGAALTIGQIGDAFTWDTLQTYRSNTDTGFGVTFAAQRAAGNAICGYHVFVNPLVSAGFYMADTGLHDGTRIINDGQGDINTGVQRLYGPGAGEVEYEGGYGFATGRGLLQDPHRIDVRDPMMFIRYDSTNFVLTTADRNYKVNLAGSGTIQDSGQSGSAVRLVSGATSTNYTSISDAIVGGGSGWFMARSVNTSVCFYPITITNVIYQIGYMDAVGTSASNGVYWEADPSVSSFWQVVCRKAGVETRVTTPFSIFSTIIDLSIFVSPAGQNAVFKYRVDGNTFYGVGGVITTNVPLIGLPFSFKIATKTASAALVDVYSVSIGSTQECTPAFS